MSEADLELLRAAYAAWNRGDVDAAFDFLDPEAEVSVPPDLPEAGTFHGRDQMKAWVNDELQPILEDMRAEPQEFFDVGDRIVVFVRYYGRGKTSGIDVRGAVVDAHVWTVRDGKAKKLEMYQGTKGALSAVGLPESAQGEPA